MGDGDDGGCAAVGIVTSSSSSPSHLFPTLTPTLVGSVEVVFSSSALDINTSHNTYPLTSALTPLVHING